MSIKGSIIKTCAYFTSINQAVSSFELWQWLYKPTGAYSLQETLQEIDTLIEEKTITEKNGLLVLKGKEQIFESIHEQFLDADRKFKEAKKAAKWISLIPGVRAINVCNTLSWEATDKQSDIDLYIITKPNSIWLTRFAATLPFKLLKKRPGQSQDPICLSFFTTDEALDMSTLKLEEDPYMAYWVLSLLPIVDDGIMQEFHAKNKWARESIPNATEPILANYRKQDERFQTEDLLYDILKTIRLLQPIEKILKSIQTRVFPEIIKQSMNKSTNVVITDKILKFHTQDNRTEIRKNWKKTTEEYEKIS